LIRKPRPLSRSHRFLAILSDRKWDEGPLSSSSEMNFLVGQLLSTSSGAFFDQSPFIELRFTRKKSKNTGKNNKNIEEFD
jgi:hypothetical protein